MGDHHINTKRDTKKHHKRGYNENQDIKSKRQERVSFKNYLQELEEELLEQEMELEYDDEYDDDQK